MNGIAEFHKVSFKQFAEDAKKTGFINEDIDMQSVEEIWKQIKLPARATGGSAGYDFYLPFPFSLRPGIAVTIPTGIRAEIQPGWCLILLPRSGLGFKHGMRFLNVVPLIDADYYFANNEGHIMAKITVDNNMCLQNGDRFMQGVFLPHGITRSDSTDGIRTGGFGSTGA